MANKISLTSDENDIGSRLDKYLAIKLNLPRSKVQKSIEAGLIAVNQKLATNKTILKLGDIITGTLAENEERQELLPAPEIPLEIVYQDDDVIVINKAAGISVHPGAGNHDKTLVNALIAQVNQLSKGSEAFRPGIVHRLDKDTSGLLIIAKNDQAHNFLAEQLQDRSLSRIYQCLVWGVPQPSEDKIEGNIRRSRANYQKMHVCETGGKEALTYYKVLANFGMTASLVEAKLSTGRTHQIRVHLAHRGHPLLGDQLYGKHNFRQRALPTELKDAIAGLGGQALHAKSIRFIHPSTKQAMSFTSELPERITRTIEALENLR